jgi:hypothetical protein
MSEAPGPVEGGGGGVGGVEELGGWRVEGAELDVGVFVVDPGVDDAADGEADEDPPGGELDGLDDAGLACVLWAVEAALVAEALDDEEAGDVGAQGAGLCDEEEEALGGLSVLELADAEGEEDQGEGVLRDLALDVDGL